MLTYDLQHMGLKLCGSDVRQGRSESVLKQWT